MLGALREVVGRDVFAAAFRDYASSWAFRHPQPWDFFRTVERHAGRDLGWFWSPAFAETATLDVGVVAVEHEAASSVVVLERSGGLILPTPVRITRSDGSIEEHSVSADRWRAEGRRIRLIVAGRVTRVEVDPDGRFPDGETSNDVWGSGVEGGS
jgi:hypothetical protein